MAIQLFGREKVASLYGTEWFEFLITTITNSQSDSSENFSDFSKALYSSDYQLSEKELNEFVEFAILWIKKHRVKNV